ncbi:MAG TPA: hypothetical protein VGQ65_00675 [Thermoanaerobaculia bacterium]|jgi:hypothetical protein|nr:hypothetical protein [Thermoanaerobaculia bacterium]
MASRAVAALFIAAIPLALAAQTTPKAIGDVTLFGEEQLKVEAATKTEIPISKAPSAVTVVTAKQIAKSDVDVRRCRRSRSRTFYLQRRVSHEGDGVHRRYDAE